MKYTEPPEGHSFHNPENVPSSPEGWRFCLTAEVKNNQDWLAKGVKCRTWASSDWGSETSCAGGCDGWTYIVPDTTPFDIPELSKQEEKVKVCMIQPFIEASDEYTELTRLTKREWFAGMAMQGILSNRHVDPTTYGNKAISELSTFFTDALIAALNQKEETK